MGKESEDLIEQLDGTDVEKKFLRAALTANTAEGVQVRAIADFYVSKRMRESADRIIASNEKLAAASGRYALALNFLTGALVLTTLALVVVGAIGLTD